MAKTAIDAPRGDMFKLEPERLTLVTDVEHPLFDQRVNNPIDDDMVKNIMVYEVIEPIIVSPNGADIEVVDGRQRVKNALEANKRLVAEGKEPIRVPAIIRRGQNHELFGVSISANEQRREDSPLSRADKAQRLLNMGKTENEVAITFGVSRQTISNWLKLQTLSAPIRKAVERGEITATAAGELSGLSAEEQKARLEEMKAEGGRMTVTRAKRSAAGEKAPSDGKRMRNRKEIESALMQESLPFCADYVTGYKAALKWVLGEDDGQADRE